jgi:diguanylate cyclase (GGDEF)-like protein
MRPVEARPKPRVPLLRRVLNASTRPIAAGGETGWWACLLPVLVVLVVAVGALNVRAATQRSQRAEALTTRAATFVSAIEEARALTGGPQARASRRSMFAALAALDGAPAGRVTTWRVEANAAARERSDTRWAALVADATSARDDFEAAGMRAQAQERIRLTAALVGGLLLALLLMWTFWARRARSAVAQRADELEQELRWQAFHDTLTGLPNRALFEDRVAHALERLRRTGEGVAVLFVDLDDFKRVNDSLGHALGDALLREFALRLGECTRRADTAARFGGDEFVVLLEGRDAADAAITVGDRIHRSLDRAFALEHEELFVHASVGIAEGSAELTAEDLIRNGDIAMYAAKTRGKGRSATFQPSMHSAARKRLQLSGDLRRALRDGELSVKYQPLVRLTDGRMLGAEALVRWAHPTLGEIQPLEFIPLAEETGLIVPVGRFVLGEACRQLRVWMTEHPDSHPDYVSVNLSVRQFQVEGQIVEDVRAAAEQAGIAPANLMLEITESVLMHDAEPIVRDLEALRALGVRIAIDDFGTGYSALSYLRQFPIDTVKMDRSFVRDLGVGKADSALIRSVVELGEALNMQIVAEGIEGQEQLDSVTGLRCAIGQGYFFSPPLDPQAMRTMLRDAGAAGVVGKLEHGEDPVPQ